MYPFPVGGIHRSVAERASTKQPDEIATDDRSDNFTASGAEDAAISISLGECALHKHGERWLTVDRPRHRAQTHAADAHAEQAKVDLVTAYNSATGQAADTTLATELGGLTLIEGGYTFSSTAGLTGTVTLQGVPMRSGCSKSPKLSSPVRTARSCSMVAPRRATCSDRSAAPRRSEPEPISWAQSWP